MNGRAYSLVTRMVADLKPYDCNACVHNETQVAQPAASIKEFGFTNPVLSGGQGTLTAGEGRVPASVHTAWASQCQCQLPLRSGSHQHRYLQPNTWRDEDMADTRFSTPVWLLRRYKEKRLEVREDQVAIVRLIFQLAMQGVSTAGIAEQLAANGKWRGPCNAKAVERLLKNRRVLGFTEGQHIAHAIISEQDFADVQAVLRSRRHGRKAAVIP